MPSTISEITRAGDRLPGTFNALVLAGSFGWGKPHDQELPPRPLARIALRPLITYTLQWLTDAGACAITICVQGRADRLRDALGDRYRTAALHYAEEQMPRGPAGCIKDAAGRMPAGPIVVVEGTLLPNLPLHDLFDAHRTSGAAMTVAATSGPAADGELRPAGIYMVERRALEYVPDTGFQDIKEAMIPRLYRAGEQVTVYERDVPSRRVVNLETYLAANYRMVEQFCAADHHMSRRSSAGHLSAADTAYVADDALIVGHVVVGAGARIEGTATIVGPAAIGDGATVAPGALVTRSVIGDRCRIGAAAIVQGSIVADGVQVAAGAKLYGALKTADRTATRWTDWLRGRDVQSSEQPLGRRGGGAPDRKHIAIGSSPQLANPDTGQT